MGMLWKVITSSEVKDVLLHSCKAPAMGVSSFGFGGTNTHACGDQSWRPKWQDWDIAPYKLIGWSVCWLIGWLVDWLIGWLIVWLVNCLMEGYSPSKNWYQDRTASRFFLFFPDRFQSAEAADVLTPTNAGAFRAFWAHQIQVASAKVV